MKVNSVLFLLMFSSTCLLAAKSPAERAKLNFDKLIKRESKKVVFVYNQEIKKAKRKKNTELMEKLLKEKNEFLENLSPLTNSDKSTDIVKFKNKLKGMRFFFGKNNKVYTDKFVLGRKGKIKYYKHQNEVSWNLDESGALVIYNISGRPQWVFTQKDKGDKLYFEAESGEYLEEK